MAPTLNINKHKNKSLEKYSLFKKSRFGDGKHLTLWDPKAKRRAGAVSGWVITRFLEEALVRQEEELQIRSVERRPLIRIVALRSSACLWH